MIDVRELLALAEYLEQRRRRRLPRWVRRRLCAGHSPQFRLPCELSRGHADEHRHGPWRWA